jgi:hypothetical protein
MKKVFNLFQCLYLIGFCGLLCLLWFSSHQEIVYSTIVGFGFYWCFSLQLVSTYVDNVLKFMISFFEKESSLFGKVGFAGAQTDLTKTINFNPLY